jgi:hypothetical protein
MFNYRVHWLYTLELYTPDGARHVSYCQIPRWEAEDLIEIWRDNYQNNPFYLYPSAIRICEKNGILDMALSTRRK